MKPKIIYMGDGVSPGAASYLIGIMRLYGFDYRHVSSATKPPIEIFNGETSLFILSDYSSSNFTEDEMEELCNCINNQQCPV